MIHRTCAKQACSSNARSGYFGACSFAHHVASARENRRRRAHLELPAFWLNAAARIRRAGDLLGARRVIAHARATRLAGRALYAGGPSKGRPYGPYANRSLLPFDQYRAWLEGPCRDRPLAASSSCAVEPIRST